jgi:hypothetical protein
MSLDFLNLPIHQNRDNATTSAQRSNSRDLLNEIYYQWLSSQFEKVRYRSSP